MTGIRERIRKAYSVRERKKFWFAYLLLLLPLAQFAVFYLYVNVDSFFVAFQDSFGNYTLRNFRRVYEGFFVNRQMLMELLRSMATWAVANFFCFPLSVIVSYALFKKIPLNMALRVLLFLPTMMGSVVMTSLYMYVVNYNGPFVSALKALGVHLPREILRNGFLGSSATAFPTILFYGVWLSLGSNVIVLTGAFVRIPQEIFEAAKLDGVGFFREFFRISIPLVYPTLNTLLIFTMATIFQADYGTFLFTRTGQFNTSTLGWRLFYEVYLISTAGVGDGNTAYGFPAALGWCISIVTIPLVLLWRRFLEKHLEAEGY